MLARSFEIGHCTIGTISFTNLGFDVTRQIHAIFRDPESGLIAARPSLQRAIWRRFPLWLTSIVKLVSHHALSVWALWVVMFARTTGGVPFADPHSEPESSPSGITTRHNIQPHSVWLGKLPASSTLFGKIVSTCVTRGLCAAEEISRRTYPVGEL